jgi:hypothetical protein
MTTAGTTNPRPPTTAPSGPPTRYAQKIESWVEEGPGSSEQAAFASSNARASIQPFWRTTSSRSNVMCAGGPPNPMSPIRSHSLAIVPSGAVGRFILRQHAK